MKRIIAMLLAIVMLVGNVPVQSFATETEPQELTACITEGCTYASNHEGNCSNFVESRSCETEGCEYEAGHEGNCSNYVESQSCETEGCEYEAGHEGNCSNYVASQYCETDGCEYEAGHEGNCSNYVLPEETDADELAAQSVIMLIEAIGKVTVESVSAISAADQAYNELTVEQKTLVTNYQILEDAKRAYMALSIPVPADEAAEPVSVTVSFTAQQNGAFLTAPQLELEVFSDTAENYGFTDQTDKVTQVSTIDVLVAAHVAEYDSEFTKDTARTYLIADGNFITKIFGKENGGDVCLLVNGFQPGNNGVQQASVEDEDLVELFVYQRDDFKDKYVWLSLPDGNKVDGQQVYGGRAVQIVVKGYSPFSYGYEGDEGETAISGASIYMVDIDTGELESLGVISDGTGTATITVPVSYIGQTVYLVAKGTETAMTLAAVEVVEAPVSAECKLTALEIAVGSKTEEPQSSLVQSFDSDTTAYTTEKLAYIGNTSNNYVWLKASAPEGAVITAENGQSGVTEITNGAWSYLEYSYYYWGQQYSGTLTDGSYNKVIITVTTADGSTKEYTVTIPVEVDLTKSKLEWKTNLASAIYYTKGIAEPNALSVEAKYTNRPLEDTSEITYQWYSNTTASTENGMAIAGATADAYTPDVTSLGKFYYYVVATCGEKTVTSKVVEVTVTEKAAPQSVSIVCDYPYTIPNDWDKALGGVSFVAKVGDTLNLKVVDENGEQTPVEWLNTGINGGTLDKESGVYTISSTSYSYLQVASLYDANMKSEEKVIVVEDYAISQYNKTPSVTLSSDGQSATKINTSGGLKDYNIWTYTVSPENSAELISGVEEKSNWINFNALRPGTIDVSFDLDLDGNGVGDEKGLSDNATLTINGIAVEDDEGKLTKTYLETSTASPNPTVQLRALSSTENATFSWSSADDSVASVDENGLVTAKGVGSVMISANDGTYTGGIKVVVTSLDTPYFEQIDFTTTTAWSNGLSNASWKTNTFKSTTLEYAGLQMTKAAASTLTLKDTTLYNTEKYIATATYTDANGVAQSITINSGAATNLTDIPFGTNTITIALTDKADETRKTDYTFEVTRPRDTTKNIANNGIVFTPVGRNLWENKYDSKTEGTMYVANADGSFAQYQGVNSSRLYYRTYAMNGLEAFTLTLKGSSAYNHIRYSSDNGNTWQYLGQTGTGGQVTDNITFPEAAAEDANPVAMVTVQILDDVTYAANIAAEKDGFEDSSPNSYTVWVEQIPVLNEDCDILTAETSHGDWYPVFREDIQNYRLMVANGAAAPVLTFTVSENASVSVDGVKATPVDGKYTLTLTVANQTITVTSSSGNTEKNYTFGYSEKSAKAVPDKVTDYLLINGQYVNGAGGGYGTNPHQTLGDTGLLSLGNFGGYVTYYYENGLTDNPNYAYGVDFYVDGNAFEDTSTGTGLGSMEPGQVWISEDGSVWYALAGSEHYEDNTIWDYTVTYAKTGTGGTGWADNQGNSHSTTHGRSFAWPEVKHYPLNSQLAAGGNIELSGILLPCADGTITGKDSFNSFSKGGRFGYVDLLPNGTNNPYLDNSDYSNANTGFDLAWAVDAAGNPVDVSGKSFHYVKVVTASNIIAGNANEKSTEVAQVYRATAQASAVGVTAAPTGVTFISGEKTYTYNFGADKQIFEVSVPKGMTTAAIQVNGTTEGDNIYVNNQRVASGTASGEFSFSTESQKLVRIIVQNGEKEPVIYLLKVKQADKEGPLSVLKFTAGSSKTATVHTMIPAFDPAIREYTLVVPDSASNVWAWATLGEESTGVIKASYTNTSGIASNVTLTSGKTTGIGLNKAIVSGKLDGNTITITVDGEAAYTVKIQRQATLSTLAITAGEDFVALTPSFSGTKYEYSADVAHNAVLAVTPTVKSSGAVVTINGAAVNSGSVSSVTPVWTERASDLVIQVSGGAGTVSSTYTIHLAQLAARLEIAVPPTKTTYVAGEAFDPAGMQVRAVYNDGFTEIIELSAYTYAPAGALSPSDREIEITFDGKTAKQSISVSSALQGSGTQSDPFLIYTAQDYQTVYDLVAKGVSFDGEYFKQMADITLPAGWEPIGVRIDPSVSHINAGKNLHAFSGNLDGNGKTLTVPEGGLPLLGYVKNAFVKNLNIYGKKIAGYGLVNNLEGYGLSGNAVTIENVTLKSGSSTLKSGLIGTYITNNQYGGCSASFVVTIRNCTIEKNVVIGYNKDQSMIGSFAGRINGTIENCTSYATVYGVNYVGGILGTRDNALGTCAVTGCTFAGTVEATREHAGGIAGGGYENSTSPNGIHIAINDCSVSGNVTGKDKVGGILGGDSFIAQTWGDDEKNSVAFKNNSFTGTVKATDGSHVGGIIGYYLSLNNKDDITGNYYKSGCGADKGIGFVKYVDTNCAAHETVSGAIYLNTETSTADCPKVTGCWWKTAHNRTDDPLGTDEAKLCYTDTHADPIAVELKVSGNYKTEYLLGDALDLTGMVLTVVYNDKSTETIHLEDATVTGYDANDLGNQTVTIAYNGLTATIIVKVQNPSTDITVTVSVLGDSAHGNNGVVHNWENGGLTTWVSAQTYTVNANATVWDVLKQVFSANGISYQYEMSLNTVYITSLTYNGVTLAEFTNGPNSGWMYKLNGKDSSNGVAQQYLKNGDVIVFHYTDDYTNEQGSSDSGNSGNAVESVEKLIDAIGTVTLNSGEAIAKARAAYAKLSDADRAKVSNYKKLTDAEEKLSDLQIKNAETLIGRIGTVTLNSIDKINDAWNAYNALTTEQKLKVSNLGVLGDAQDKYNNLRAEEVENLIDQIDTQITLDSETRIVKARKAYNALSKVQQALVDKEHLEKLKAAELALANLKATEEDKEKAKQVMDMIDKLGNITLTSEMDILAAREAYEKLTDVQKALVTNYDLLVTAEEKLEGLKHYAVFEEVYTTTGDYLENLGAPEVGSIGGEWMVLGLLRSGRNVSEDYYEKAVAYIRENIDENGHLHRAKSSENSRLILALTALGKDVTNVDGYNLLRGLSDMEFVQYQGINGPIWALIALDSGNYPTPEGNVSRESLIQVILDAQLSDGGWALSGDESDADITGMALQALAPYYEENSAVKLAVEEGVALLANIQNADGTFGTFDGNGSKVVTCESSAQVVVALTALGIDPAKDARFVKNNISALDALIEFYVTGGGFKHLIVGNLDGMATEQAYYALTAYYRFLMGETNLFDMTDVIDMGGDQNAEETIELTEDPTEPMEGEENNGNAVVIWAGVMTLCVAAIIVLILNSKKLFGRFL